MIMPNSKQENIKNSGSLKLVIRFSIVLILLNFVFLGFLSQSSQASQFPRYLGNEKKFRAYIYNPNDVYRYIGHYTYQGFIEFGATETISTISMGDTSLWLFEYLGNRLFLKPISQNADTNMTVITNEKVYHFELTAKIAQSIDDKDLIFVVKFIYPDEKDKNIIQFPKKPITDEPDMRNLSIYNFNYEFTGEPSIAPIKVFDNGIFTYMQFSGNNPEMPAAFSVDSAGFEELVNFRVAGDYMIVERVSPQFTLRSGSDIVCVYNNNRLQSGRLAPPPSANNKAVENAASSYPDEGVISTPFPVAPKSPATSMSKAPNFGGNPFGGGFVGGGGFPDSMNPSNPNSANMMPEATMSIDTPPSKRF